MSEVQTPLTMIYTNWRGDTADRRILPVGTLEKKATAYHPEPQWIMRAWDYDKEAYRDFALADCQFGKADHADALVAAAYEAAASPEFLRPLVDGQSCGEWTDLIIDTDTKMIGDAIRALTPADAKAAFDAHVKRAVEAAEAKLAKAVEALGWALEGLEDAIGQPMGVVPESADWVYDTHSGVVIETHEALAKMDASQRTRDRLPATPAEIEEGG